MKLFQKTFTKEEIKKALPYFIISAIIMILDQWSKLVVSDSFYIGENLNIIDGFLKFTYVHNKGAAFSMGSLLSDEIRLVIFKVLPVFAGVFFVYQIIKSQEKVLMKVFYALVLGGGAGNVIDRIRLDYVVDFISVYHRGFTVFGFEFDPWYFAIFNIADSAVSLAAIILISDYVIIWLKSSKSKSDVSKV